VSWPPASAGEQLRVGGVELAGLVTQHSSAALPASQVDVMLVISALTPPLTCA